MHKKKKCLGTMTSDHNALKKYNVTLFLFSLHFSYFLVRFDKSSHCLSRYLQFNNKNKYNIIYIIK